MRYGGGVGGISIPLNKAVAQWDKANRADLTLVNHYHQYRYFGNIICNGSMIGYNAYALSIKADYEPPCQNFFLINKTKGLTVSSPILFS